MKQFFNKSANKSAPNIVPKGVVILDDSVAGAVLIAKLRTLPLQIVYVNVAGATSFNQANAYVSAILQGLDLSNYVVALPSPVPKQGMFAKHCGQARIIKCEPPLYQAMQYATRQVAVVSSTNRTYDNCITIDGTHLANLIKTGASERQLRAHVQQLMANADGCDAVAFDDCIFSLARNNFWMEAPNVKFFDCADGLVSCFYKNKKLRQNNTAPSLLTNFCDQTGKTEEIFNKILQKIYKPY